MKRNFSKRLADIFIPTPPENIILLYQSEFSKPWNSVSGETETSPYLRLKLWDLVLLEKRKELAAAFQNVINAWSSSNYLRKLCKLLVTVLNMHGENAHASWK